MASRRNKITYSKRPNHAARTAHARGESQFKTYDTSHIRPKRSKLPLIVGIIIILLVGVLGVWGGMQIIQGCNGALLAEGETVEITIEEGSSTKDIGSLLSQNKVVSNQSEFVKRVNELDAAKNLKPGVYTFTGGMSLDEVIKMLQAGPGGLSDSFTIPEGLKLEEVAQRVEDAYGGDITKDEFLSCAQDASTYEADFPFVAEAYDNSLEGFLFPKTYPVNAGASADSVVRMMLSQYQTEIAPISFAYAEEQGLSAYQVLVMASLIEREASLDEERPLVASVIYNRLASDMLLQIDASVAYAQGVVELTPEDLQIESPYNTYLNKGLPPGPICSPGLASIQAATSPAESEYLYYVVTGEGDGSHHFSTTYEEHVAYIEELS